MPYGNFLDPAQEFYLELERQIAEETQRELEVMATPEFAANVINTSITYPHASSALNLAFAQGGIPAGDPIADQLAYEEMLTRDTLGPIEKPGEGWWDSITGVLDEWVVNPLQGTTRWAFSAWDAAYQMIAGGAPIRAEQYADIYGTSYGEGWRAQDPYFLEAVGGLFSNSPRTENPGIIEQFFGNVNLGSGWLPQSEVAPTVEEAVTERMRTLESETNALPASERYAARLQAAPDIWRQAITDNAEAQAEFGKPLTQLNYADTELPLFTNRRGERFPWSPGRIVAAQVFEPGTTPYHAISGTGDFLSQVFLDPVDWIGLGWAKTGVEGRKIWGTASRLADEVAGTTDEATRAITAGPTRPALPAGAADEALPSGVTPQRYYTGADARPIEYEPLHRPHIGEGRTTVGEGVEPWRVSGAEPGRTAGPFDPPQWWIDEVRRIQDSVGIPPDELVFRRKMAGIYEMDLPRKPGARQLQVRIQRRGSGKNAYWEAVRPDGTRVGLLPDDPRFTTPQTRFRTLKEAKEAAISEAERYVQVDMRVGGMTPDEFANSGEDFYLYMDGHTLFDQSKGYARTHKEGVTSYRGSTRKVRRSEIVTPRGVVERPEEAIEGVSGIRTRVFGRTIDLSDGTPAALDDLPAGLRNALDADGHLGVEGGRQVLRGSATDPRVDKWDNTLAWMDANGYGKMKWSDDDVLLNERFIGGNSADPMQRIWFETPDTPIGPLIEDIEDLVPTAGEVNEVLTEIERAVRRADNLARGIIPDEALTAEEFDILMEARWRLGLRDELTPRQREVLDTIRRVNGEDGPPGAFRQGRPRGDFDPTYKLRGKRANMFLDRLLSTTRRAGQEGDISQMDRLLGYLEKRNIKIPNSVRTALYESTSKSELEQIFTRWLMTEGPHEIVLPGGAQFGRLAAAGVRLPRVRLSDNTWFGRQMAMNVPTRPFNMIEDPSEAYARFTAALPHYKLRRGEVVPVYNDLGIATGETISVENILERLRLLKPNADKAQAFDILTDWHRLLYSKLVDTDQVSPALANRVSKWWREAKQEAIYEAEWFGKTHLTDGPYDMTIVNDELVGGLHNAPQMSAQLWTGEVAGIPDPRTLRRTVAYTDTIGKIANNIALKKVGDDLKFEERALIRWYDTLITKAWKPFVLLRGAWTLRILMDDQFRMAGEGYSVLNHPLRIINYALTQTDDWRTAFRKGFVDINGVRFRTDAIDEMDHAQYLIRALMSRPDDPRLGMGAYGRRQITRAARGTDDYIDGLLFELEGMVGTPLMKVLADADLNHNNWDAVDYAVKWLTDDLPSAKGRGAKELENLAAQFRKQPEIAERILAKDYDTLYDIVSKQYAALHHKTGGEVVLHTGRGDMFNFQLDHIGREEPGMTRTLQAGGERGVWEVKTKGDEDLLRIVQETGSMSTEAARKAVRETLSTKTRAAPHQFPKFVRVAREVTESGYELSALDEAVRGFYNFFMTKPSDALSRIPEFRRAYWERMADLFPYGDDAVQEAILARAPNREVRRALENARKRGEDVKGQITDLWIPNEGWRTGIDQVDEIAKAYGLTMVERTLFDLANKRNISDALRLVFPFVEAWGEFISRWGRIMVYGDRNIYNARRFQQAVEGLRESNPFDHEDQQGFFYENDFGQEVFNYPSFLTDYQIQLHNIANDLPVVGNLLGENIPDDIADNIVASGSVESLNFASGVIPGFGPIFQFAAKKFPQDPKFDWVRDLLAPFGTEGGFLGTIAPAWVKRIMSARGGYDDPQLEYTYASTVMDVQRTMIDNGEYAGVSSQADIDELNALAEERAKGVLMVRAAATFWNPTSPSYRFQKEDKTGLVWSYSNLGREFYEMTQELGSESAAWDEFYRRFGFLPAAFIGGKTYSIIDRSLTEEGYRFERSQPELFARYPSTAMYLDPTIDMESQYDHSAMLAQLRTGEREAWTGEQFIYLQQDQLGDLWWDNVNRNAMLIEDRTHRDTYLMAQRAEIQRAYPYWNKPVPGKVQSVTNDEQMAEVFEWLSDEDLRGQPIVEAARQYEQYRHQVLNQLMTMGASTIDGPSSPDTEAGQWATFGREWLRQKATEIEAEVPQFGELFRSVYAFEVDPSHDQPMPPELTLYDDSDILTELGLTRIG